MDEHSIGIEQARKNLGDLADAARHAGTTTILTRHGRPIARIAPLEDTVQTATYTLISATTGDQVPGVEISDPESPIGWHDLPAAAQRWAERQGYGEHDEELLYVLADGEELPVGYPAYRVEPEATEQSDEAREAAAVAAARERGDIDRARDLESGARATTILTGDLNGDTIAERVYGYVNDGETSAEQTAEILDDYLDALTEAARERGVTWSVRKCEALHPLWMETETAVERIEEAFGEVDLGAIVDSVLGDD